MKGHIDSEVLATTAGFSCGISTSACSIVLERFVTSPPFSSNRPLTDDRQHQSQANARQRTSMVAPSLHQVNRHRADSTGNRVRSDSQLTTDTHDGIETVRHPVEPRARTSLLPPIMVRQLSPSSFDVLLTHLV